jgi:crotonobetainyl-CoA:carnitine CoA-transferase CaiB-like acyl-CoA transferase/NAD(P)-dependent dehydrogenase (short-subunit alcohol dehydrogenase family)
VELRFDGRAVIITGGGSGIGRSHAARFAARGARVLVCDDGASVAGDAGEPNLAETVAGQIRAAGGDAVGYSGDVGEAHGARGAVQAALEHFGRIDVIMHNVGFSNSVPSVEREATCSLDKLLPGSVKAAWEIISEAWPVMLQQRYGRIVLIRPSGMYRMPGGFSLGAVDASYVGLINCLGEEAARSGIKINAVLPGHAAGISEQMPDLERRTWLTEAMKPEPSSAVAMYLGHELCAVNGTALTADGGRVAQTVLAETGGYVDTQLSPEAIRDHIGEITGTGALSAIPKAPGLTHQADRRPGLPPAGCTGTRRAGTVNPGTETGERTAAADPPLATIRVLALEQMQALPVATQLLARLGAEVVKVEDPVHGDSARAARPAIFDRSQVLGATFLRYNQGGKKSVAIDIRQAAGRDLVLDLLGDFDIVCENLGPGRPERYGLDYETCAARYPSLIYLSISGFGQTGSSPYRDRPAYAPVVEAMSGLADFVRTPGQPPVVNPGVGLGDTAAGLYGTIGVLAALAHRNRTGAGSYVDIAMFDSMLALTDSMYNYWSLGLRKDEREEFPNPVLLDSFRSGEGWFIVCVIREHQFDRFARAIGHPELLSDPRVADRAGWRSHTESLIRPLVEGWAATRTKHEAAAALTAAGVAAAPANGTEDLLRDQHVREHRMLIPVRHGDGTGDPVLIAGNPIKIAGRVEPASTDYPRIGEHTAQILRDGLGLNAARLRQLESDGLIALDPDDPERGRRSSAQHQGG